MKKDEITCDIIRDVRCEMTDAIEEIGQALGLLREACGDCDDNNNIQGAQMAAADAANILGELEEKFSSMAARVARWSAAK
jgi:hypothetical protein